MPTRFECNSLIDHGEDIELKRGPHGNSACGKRKYYYRSKNWNYRALNRTCPGTNAAIFEMVRKSATPTPPVVPQDGGDLIA